MPELWDLYDSLRRPLGRTHPRGKALTYGTYHLVVFAWVLTDREELLLSRRHPDKSYGGFWECTGGCVLAGEDTRAAAVRELSEEVGVRLRPAQAVLARTVRRVDDFADTFIFRAALSPASLCPQPGEVTEARLVTLAEYDRMCADGLVVPSALGFRRLYGALQAGTVLREKL